MKYQNTYISFKNTMKFLVLFTIFLFSCSQDAEKVNPADIINDYFSNPSGTTLMQTTFTYPADTDTGIPLNANIVLVFSKNVKASTVASSILINGGAVTYTSTVSNNMVTLDPTVNFAYGASYTVTVSTGLQADIDSQPLDTALSFTFTAATTDSPSTPIVLTGTRYPANGATGVSINLPYVEVTFSKPVTNVTTGTFTISPAVAGCTVSNPYGNTWRLTLGAALAYSPPAYTVSLSNTIVDTALPTSNAITAHSWSFTTETDPNASPNPTTINNPGIASVTDVQSIICFNTDTAITRLNSKIEYGLTPALGSVAVETAWDATIPSGIYTNHGVIISGLLPNTLYYYRIWVDVDGSLTHSAGDLYYPSAATSNTFYTKTNSTGGVTTGSPVTTAATSPSKIKTVQLLDGSSYVFWIDNGVNLKCQFFSTAGSPGWAAGGLTINTVANVSDFYAVRVANGDALVIYKTTANALYARRITTAGADNAGWSGETNLAVTVKAGSSFTADFVHYRPKMWGTAVKPTAGYPTNILFDMNVDFSASGLLLNDIILWDNAGSWANGLLYDTNSWNIYKYILRSDQSINLTAKNYYIADQTVTMSGTVTSYTAGTKTLVFDNALSTNLTGYILFDSSISKYAIISSDTVTGVGPYTHTLVLDIDIGAAATESISVYPKKLGPLTSEVISNPIWDAAPYISPMTVSVFTGNVTAGDYVLSSTNSNTTINSVVSNYALQLTADIMNNNDAYYIFSSEASGTAYLIAGTNTGSANNFMLDDTGNDFITAAVLPGDIVYNITDNLSAEVVSRKSSTKLELTADIFNNIGRSYVIYRKDIFMVAYIDAADDVIAKKFNLSDGSVIGSTITVAAGTYSNPHIVSDGIGNAMFFYEGGGNIHDKKIDITGTTAFWTNANIRAGLSIKHVLPAYRQPNRGAYLLAASATQFQVSRVSSSLGTVSTSTALTTGTSPYMCIDINYSNTNGSNILVSYLTTHAVASVNYTHVMAWGIDYNAGNLFGPVAVTNSTTAAYHTQYPVVTVSDLDYNAAENFYITWYDGMYYPSIGYSIYAARFNSTGTKQWGSDLFVCSPSSYGITGQIEMAVPFYNAGSNPFGIIPIWLDFRTNTSSTNIYYRLVKENGTLP